MPKEKEMLQTAMKAGVATISKFQAASDLIRSKNPYRTHPATLTEEQKTILRDRALENFKRTAKELRRYLTPETLNMLHNVLDELQDEIGGTF